MADTQVVISSDPAVVVEDAWKDIRIKKEHQPEKVKSSLTYRRLEQQMENIDNNIASFTEEKATLEAEMAQVKAAAEAE